MTSRFAPVSLAVLAIVSFGPTAAAAAPLASPAVALPAQSLAKTVAYSQTVRDIQAELNARGYNAGPADGLMGSRTSAAISAYQRDKGLLVTGQASQSLLSHIRAPATTAPSAEAREERREEMIERTQERLAVLGYSVEPTGVVDWQTRTAISKYQGDNGLTVTGDLDRDLARHIRLRADAGGVSVATMTDIERGLKARGYDTGIIDGRADAQTRAAIRAYQRDRGIAITGEPTNELANLLREGVAEDLNTTENIMAVQKALNERGYSAGPADGVMGPSTRGAIQSYRQRQGLTPEVGVTTSLLQSLGIGGAVAASPSAPATPPADPAYTTVMTDDFSDGDYTRNPDWHVHAGVFSVVNEFLSVEVPEATTDPGQQIIAGVLSQALGVNLGQNAAGIAQGNDITNAFKIETTMLGSAKDIVRMHLGPYLGSDITSGYRLVFDEESNNRLSIVARSSGGARTVASQDGVSALADGRRHAIVWTREKDGRMTVSVDGVETLSASDRSITSAFSGYSFVALSGAWNIHQVTTASAN